MVGSGLGRRCRPSGKGNRAERIPGNLPLGLRASYGPGFLAFYLSRNTRVMRCAPHAFDVMQLTPIAAYIVL